MLQLRKPLRLADRSSEQEIQISCVRSFDLLGARRAEWNALVERSQNATVFQTFEWHASWWRTFGDDFGLLVVCAERAGRLVGLAPLMVAKRRILGRRLRVLHFIGLYASDYCDFIIDDADPEALPAMLRWLADNTDVWDGLDLRNLVEGSPTLVSVAAFFAQQGDPVDLRRWGEAPSYVFGDPKADRDLLRKKSLRRHCNRFERSGKLEFYHFRTAREISTRLEAFFRQHIERWDATDTPSQFLAERQRSFYREMVDLLAPTGALLLSVVSFNDAPIAFHLGFEYRNRFIWYKPTYDISLARHSPGEVLLKCLFEHAHNGGLQEFDFAPGEEAFKYRFANHARSICSVHVFKDRLTWRYDRLRFAARMAVKGSPRLARLGRRFLGRLYGRLWY